MSYLVFVPQDITTNAALCQPGWRETNARPSTQSATCKPTGARRESALTNQVRSILRCCARSGKKLVIKDDTFGVVQRGGSWSAGPPDLDRPWVTSFTVAELCHIKTWPPLDLAHYLKLNSNVTTSYQRSEDGEVVHDVSSIEVLHKLQSVGRRDTTLTMLALSRPRRFKVPKWCRPNSLLVSASSHLCSHENFSGEDDVVFQLCQSSALTQSHCDSGGNGALLSLLSGRKLFALTAPRPRQFRGLEKWSSKDQTDPAYWWSEFGMHANTPIFVVELRALESIWIPSGWVHFVLTLEEAQQVCHNFIPAEVMPRSIIQWRHERKTKHSKTPCVLPCRCQPDHGPSHFPTVVAQFLRSRPEISTAAA